MNTIKKRRKRRWYGSVLCIFFYLNLAVLYAMDYSPVMARNLNPFSIGRLGLLPQNWQDLHDKAYSFNLHLEMGNYSMLTETAGEKIVMDGETYLSTAELVYAFNDQIRGKIALPLIRHSSGFLDNGIEQWHEWFGLSNSRRTEFSSNQLHYEYLNNGLSQVKLTESTGGPGDISLTLSYFCPSTCVEDYQISYNLDIKLATGDPARLTGSGAEDIGLSAHFIRKNLTADEDVALYGGLGFIMSEKTEVLGERQKDINYGAYAGAEWLLQPQISLSVQLNLQSAYFSSELPELGKHSAQLLLAGKYKSSEGIEYRLALGENLFTDATPDFSLHFSIQSDFNLEK